MKCNVERVIEALIGVELTAARGAAAKKQAHSPHLPVVTVSRTYGSLGRVVAETLAARLGVRCCDREILEGVARRAQVDVELVERLDERVKAIKGDWWRAFVTGKSLSRDAYLGYLVKVVLAISQTGGVILGRGANFILRDQQQFRLRVVGSRDVCAARIAKRKGIALVEAGRRVTEVNSQRAAFVRDFLGGDTSRPEAYDLVVNTDRLSVDTIVEMVMLAMPHGAGA
jgi:hypothetical protein